MNRVQWLLSVIALVMIALAIPSARIQGSFIGSPVAPKTCTELVSDGGFEQGGQGWAQYSKLGFQLVSSFYRRSGRLAAWLGAENQAHDRLSQLIVLPAQTDRVTLNLWWALSTDENPGGAFDFLHVGLYSPDGATERLALLDAHNDSAEPWVWNLLSADLTAYAGQSLQLRIEATTDENNPTSFFVDDVGVLSCVAAGVTPSPTVTATATPTITLTPTGGTPFHSTPSATPTATPTASPTLTLVTLVPSATWTATSTVIPPHTATSTPADLVTSTPTKTLTPGPMTVRLYLPAILRTH